MFNSLQGAARYAFLVAAAFLTLTGATAQQPLAAQSRTMVLQGGTLIDGTGKAPITDAVVVVQAGRITAVGKRGQVRIPAGAQVIKTDGRTILPGLIDSHVHVQDFHWPFFLHYGVTSILAKVSDPAWTVAMRQGLAEGTIKGPRMYWTGATIDGIAVRLPGGGGSWNTHVTRTPEETASYMRTLLANGADAINMNQSISYDQLSAMLAVGKEKNVTVMGHVPNIRHAAELGHIHMEHFFMLGAALVDPQNKTDIGNVTAFAPEALADPAKIPELVDFMVKRGVFINPTLVAQWTNQGQGPRGPEIAKYTAAIADDPASSFVPFHVRDLWHKAPADPRLGYAVNAEFLKQYVAKGGKIVVGTDAGYRTIPGFSVHYEMMMLTDAGLTPMQAIQSATLWNAQVMKADKDIGSVEVGKYGDFTIIEGDPLKDITATRNIRMVIKGGQVQDTKVEGYVIPIPAPYMSYNIDQNITKVIPAIVRQGGPAVTLELDSTIFTRGTAGFFENSIVRFENTDLPTKYVSRTKLTATLPAELMKKAPGLYPLYVYTPGLHGTISDGAAYVVIDTAEAPVKSVPVPLAAYAGMSQSLVGPIPRMAPQGGPSQTVEIVAKVNTFQPGAIMRFDNVDLPTKFISPTRLQAVIDAKLLQRAPGSYVLYAITPGVFGTVSKPAYFQVGFKNGKMVWKEPLEP